MYLFYSSKICSAHSFFTTKIIFRFLLAKVSDSVLLETALPHSAIKESSLLYYLSLDEGKTNSFMDIPKALA